VRYRQQEQPRWVNSVALVQSNATKVSETCNALSKFLSLLEGLMPVLLILPLSLFPLRRMYWRAHVIRINMWHKNSTILLISCRLFASRTDLMSLLLATVALHWNLWACKQWPLWNCVVSCIDEQLSLPVSYRKLVSGTGQVTSETVRWLSPFGSFTDLHKSLMTSDNSSVSSSLRCMAKYLVCCACALIG